jgi:rRNA-processing protein EBP2
MVKVREIKHDDSEDSDPNSQEQSADQQ